MNKCLNRPPIGVGYWVQDGWIYRSYESPLSKCLITTREPRMIWHQSPWAGQGCGHDMRNTDPECAGCRWTGGSNGRA